MTNIRQGSMYKLGKKMRSRGGGRHENKESVGGWKSWGAAELKH